MESRNWLLIVKGFIVLYHPQKKKDLTTDSFKRYHYSQGSTQCCLDPLHIGIISNKIFCLPSNNHSSRPLNFLDLRISVLVSGRLLFCNIFEKLKIWIGKKYLRNISQCFLRNKFERNISARPPCPDCASMGPARCKNSARIFGVIWLFFTCVVIFLYDFLYYCFHGNFPPIWLTSCFRSVFPLLTSPWLDRETGLKIVS